MGFRGRKSSHKNPPIFSYEFLIVNHGDIVSCITFLFVVGLLIQTTSPLAYVFVALQHNLTLSQQTAETSYYSNGWKDVCTIFFYFLLCIVFHAFIQEYALDKITRKLHLSKIKHNLFNESGQLIVFYGISLLWGIDLIFRENIVFNVASLWEGYPHAAMTFIFKFFYIIQISYWLHCFPEVFFYRVKKENIPKVFKQASTYLAFIGFAYVFNFTRVALCLIVLQYLSETISHGAMLLDFASKNEGSLQVLHFLSKIVFVLVRLGSIILSVLTFWYGLSLNENQGLDISSGNFNNQIIRMVALVAVGTLQAYLMWNFITSQLVRLRELSTFKRFTVSDRKKVTSNKKEKKNKSGSTSSLPEVDQNMSKKNQQKVKNSNKKGK